MPREKWSPKLKLLTGTSNGDFCLFVAKAHIYSVSQSECLSSGAQAVSVFSLDQLLLGCILGSGFRLVDACFASAGASVAPFVGRWLEWAPSRCYSRRIDGDRWWSMMLFLVPPRDEQGMDPLSGSTWRISPTLADSATKCRILTRQKKLAWILLLLSKNAKRATTECMHRINESSHDKHHNGLLSLILNCQFQ